MNKKTKRVIKGALLVVVAVFAWTGVSLSSGLAAPELAKRQKKFQQALKMNQLDDAEKIVQSFFDAKYDALATKLKIQLLRARIKHETITSNWLKEQEELLKQKEETLQDTIASLQKSSTDQSTVIDSISVQMNKNIDITAEINKKMQNNVALLEQQEVELKKTESELQKKQLSNEKEKKKLDEHVQEWKSLIDLMKVGQISLQKELSEAFKEKEEQRELLDKAKTFKEDLDKKLVQASSQSELDPDMEKLTGDMQGFEAELEQLKQRVDSEQKELQVIKQTVEKKKEELQGAIESIENYKNKRMQQLNTVYTFLVGGDQQLHNIDEAETFLAQNIGGQIKAIDVWATGSGEPKENFTDVTNLLGAVAKKAEDDKTEEKKLEPLKKFFMGELSATNQPTIEEALLNFIGSLYVFSGVDFDFAQPMKQQWDNLFENYSFIDRDSLAALSKLAKKNPDKYLNQVYHDSLSPKRRIKSAKEIKGMFNEVKTSSLDSIKQDQLLKEPIENLRAMITSYFNSVLRAPNVSIKMLLGQLVNYDNKFRLAAYIQANREIVQQMLEFVYKRLNSKDAQGFYKTIKIVYGPFMLIPWYMPSVVGVIRQVLKKLSNAKPLEIEQLMLGLSPLHGVSASELASIQEKAARIKEFGEPLKNDIVKNLEQGLGDRIRGSVALNSWKSEFASLIKKLKE